MPAPKLINNVKFLQKCIIVRTDLPAGRQVLALRREPNAPRRPSCWDLPGGGYEQGEDVIAAIQREVMEEVGLIANTLNPIFFTNKIGVTEGFFQGNNVFGMCYVCRKWSGEVVLSSEHTEFKWIVPKEFLALNFGADNGFFKSSMTSYLQTIK